MTSNAARTHNATDANMPDLNSDTPAEKPSRLLPTLLTVPENLDRNNTSIGPNTKAKRANHAAVWLAAVRRGELQVSITNVLASTI